MTELKQTKMNICLECGKNDGLEAHKITCSLAPKCHKCGVTEMYWHTQECEINIEKDIKMNDRLIAIVHIRECIIPEQNINAKKRQARQDFLLNNAFNRNSLFYIGTKY